MTGPLILLTLAAGVLIGIIVLRWLERRERRRMNADWMEIAGHHEAYGQILDQDPARLGIDHGVHYATSKMRQTLEELESRNG